MELAKSNGGGGALEAAMQALEQTEHKLKAMEEDFNAKNLELEKLKLEKKKLSEEAACQTLEGCDNNSKLASLEQQVSLLTLLSKQITELPDSLVIK